MFGIVCVYDAYDFWRVEGVEFGNTQDALRWWRLSIPGTK
jgi:hypothetical protein